MAKETQASLRRRDSVLQSADTIVKTILGKRWTMDRHMELKAALLNMVDGGR